MSQPDQRVAEVAIARAAAQAAAAEKARKSGVAPKPGKKSSDLLTAFVVCAVLVTTLVLAIAFQR